MWALLLLVLRTSGRIHVCNVVTQQITSVQPSANQISFCRCNNQPELSGKSWWVTPCFVSPFSHQAPFCSFPNPHAVSLYLYTSIDLPILVAGDICRSLGVVTGRRGQQYRLLDLLEGTAPNLVVRSNCAVKQLVWSFLHFRYQHHSSSPATSPILNHFSLRQTRSHVVAIIIKNNCGVDQTFQSLLVPKFQFRKTKLHATRLNVVLNQLITSLPLYNLNPFLCSMGSS